MRAGCLPSVYYDELRWLFPSFPGSDSFQISQVWLPGLWSVFSNSRYEHRKLCMRFQMFHKEPTLQECHMIGEVFPVDTYEDTKKQLCWVMGDLFLIRHFHLKSIGGRVIFEDEKCKTGRRRTVPWYFNNFCSIQNVENKAYGR